MLLGTYERFGRLALSALSIAVLSSFTPPVLAQSAPTSECGTTTPGGSGNLCDDISGASVSTGDTCGFARGATGCTANDFVGQATVTSNTVTGCHIGDLVPAQSLTFSITGSSATRYAVGLFVGEQSQNLAVAGGTCSVATFPTSSTNPLPARTPYPWFAANTGDVCGSYSPNFTSMEQVDGITYTCNPDVNGNPQVTFMVVYAQNAAGASACTGPHNVAPGTTSKCTVGGTAITNVVVTYNADPLCTAGLVYDPVAHTVSVTFHVFNNGPDSAGPAGGGDVTFEDVVPSPATVTGVTCINAAGGAVCGAVGHVGNDVTGTIDTLPNGGSVDIVISGTVPPNPGQVTISGNFTLAVNGTVVVVPAGWDPNNNTCASAQLLPVRLQSFDVK